jgi:predicted N-acetyltransferase YhbS
LNIRQEQSRDYTEVYELVKTAFAASSHSDGSEADYLNAVRKKDTFIPELSLVAEDETGKIIGQIVLYKTDVNKTGKTSAELVLSPICVHPDCFRRGIARALMERAFDIAKEMGYTLVFLCGEPEIYRKIVFVTTYKNNIFHITDVEKNAEWCMARELVDGALADLSGTIDIV